MKFENRISGLEPFKRAAPPIATYCSIAKVFNALVFYCVLHMNMAAYATSDIFKTRKQLRQLSCIRVKQCSRNPPVSIRLIFILKHGGAKRNNWDMRYRQVCCSKDVSFNSFSCQAYCCSSILEIYPALFSCALSSTMNFQFFLLKE